MRSCSIAGPWRAETLSFTSLYVSTNIHTFFLASRTFGFGMALSVDANGPSSLLGVVRGRRGGRMRRPSYLVCSLSGALQRHPSTM